MCRSKGFEMSLLACVALPWLPYEGLFPKVLPFPHPPNLLLVTIDVLSHQDLREKNTEEEGGDASDQVCGCVCVF